MTGNLIVILIVSNLLILSDVVRLLKEEEALNIRAMPICPRAGDDKLIWSRKKTGLFCIDWVLVYPEEEK